MANSDAGTGSGNAGGREHQVFLNFRGKDTRYGFTSFLHRDLENNGIHAFKDNKRIRVGEKIGGALKRAIPDSQIYVPIFSENYASSKWCLRELEMMVDNVKKQQGKKILPIFYYVERDDVALKNVTTSDVKPDNVAVKSETTSYRKAIENHKAEHEKKQQEKLPNEPESWEGEFWEEALKYVCKIKGWELRKGESQAQLVGNVVQAVLRELKTRVKSVTKDLVGLDDRKKEVLERLDVKCSGKVRLLGIHGMGGIGKTTLARVVYNELHSCFGEWCAFLDDIRETSKKEGLVSLQKKLLTAIGKSVATTSINNVDYGRKRIAEILGKKKVLVVLDDVGEEEQIENLIGQVQFQDGTRVIITTRNTRVLEFIKRRMDHALQLLTYEMKGMKSYYALELFKGHAFHEGSLGEDFDSLSVDIVNTTGGLPLALKVIGSLLRGKSKPNWEYTLKQLIKIPHKDVQKRLMISYKELNYRQREIFLDIACFFINEDKTNANYMWEACGLYPNVEIDILVEMSLINIKDNKFWMHDQLRDLGREIVCQESPTILGRRSRLWMREEVLDLVRTKQRKDKVEAIDLGGSPHFLLETEEIEAEEIERFESLRFLRLSNQTLYGDFTDCLPMLKWISWSSPLLNCRVANMHLQNLVVLEFFHNYFEDDSKVWDSLKTATKLKSLTLAHCFGITRTPNLSKCLDLERLTFDRCTELKEIDDSIEKLKRLLDLSIIYCRHIKQVPNKIGGLVKLERFSLINNDEVSKLPISIGNLASLRKLDLSYAEITSLPNSIKKLRHLSDLCLKNTKIRHFPKSILELTSLCTLDLSRFMTLETTDEQEWKLPKAIRMLNKLEELYLGRRNELVGKIPDEIGNLSSLRVLDLCQTEICEVPGTINGLKHLSTLDLTRCDKIKELPELPASLVHLRVTSKFLQVVPNLSKLTNIVELVLSDGSEDQDSSKLKPPCDLRWIGSLSKLKKLKLCLLKIDVPPTELGALSHLEDLTLFRLNLQPLEQLPPSLLLLTLDNFEVGSAQSNLKIPSKLTLCLSQLEEIKLGGVLQLQHLYLIECELQRLVIPSSLRILDVDNCSELIEIGVLDLSASLEKLSISECKFKEIELCDFPDQSESSSSESTYCSRNVLCLPNALMEIKNLLLSWNRSLLKLQVIDTLSSLQSIFFDNCYAMKELTGMSNLKNLQRLTINGCSKLRVVEGLDELECLTSLRVKRCRVLETFVDISKSKIPDECEITVEDCRKLLNSRVPTTFKRYKRMAQQGAPKSETNKEKAKIEGDAEEPNTELQPQFHPSASSQDHEISKEHLVENVKKRRRRE